jgi:hypothetical protein
MPRSIAEMSSDELEALLTNVRKSRLRGAEIYAEAMAAAQLAADDKARDALTAQCDMLTAAMERVDKAVEAMEGRIIKIRALRLELGLE